MNWIKIGEQELDGSKILTYAASVQVGVIVKTAIDDKCSSIFVPGLIIEDDKLKAMPGYGMTPYPEQEVLSEDS